MANRVFLSVLLVLAFFCLPGYAGPKPPVIVPSYPDLANDQTYLNQKAALDQRRSELLGRYQAWKQRADAFNQKYADHEFDPDSAEAKDGAKEQLWLAGESEAYIAEWKKFQEDVNQFIFLEKGTRAPVKDPASKVNEVLATDAGNGKKQDGVLLAADPVAAQLSSLRLQDANKQIDLLTKEIAVLDANDQQATKEWADIHNEMNDNANDMIRKGFDIMTLGLAEEIKAAANGHVELAESAKQSAVWQELLIQEQKLIDKSKVADGAEKQALLDTVAAMKHLEVARDAQYLADGISKVRDALTDGKEIQNQIKDAVHNPDIASAIYSGSCAMGQVGMIFFTGAGKEIIAPAQALSNAGQIVLLYKSVNEEQAQFDELSHQSYDRHQERLKLDSKLGQLEGEKQTLEWAVQHASGTDNK